MYLCYRISFAQIPRNHLPLHALGTALWYVFDEGSQATRLLDDHDAIQNLFAPVAEAAI